MAKPFLNLSVSSFLFSELISRASGFIMMPHLWKGHSPGLGLGTSKPAEVPIMSVAHTFRPHRWKRLYPNEDWINELEGHELDITIQIEAVDEQGKVHGRWPGQAVYFHERLDLVAIKGASPDFTPELARLSADFDASGILQTEFSVDETLQAPVSLFGCSVQNCGLANETYAAQKVDGKITHHSAFQVFTQTSQRLETGMCGGPVVDASGHLVGMLEGIINVVPPNAIASPERDIQALVAGQGAAIRRNMIEGFLPLALKWSHAV